MSLRMSAAAVTIGVLVSAACLAPELAGELDLRPPAVIGLSLGPLDAAVPPGLDALGAIAIRFSEPLDSSTVGPETIWVVRGRDLEGCAATSFCARGRCLDERCLLSAADAAFRIDANSPPLSVSRQALAHAIDVELEPSGDVVELTPRVPYQVGQLYTVVVSAAVRDRAGNPLVAPDGRWEGFFYDFVAGAEPTGAPRAELVWPAADSLDVPPNLGEVVVGFDALVSGAIPSGIWLVSEAGSVATRVGDGAGRCPEPLRSCLVVAPAETLERSIRYDLAWSYAVVGPGGEPVPLPETPLGFTTGAVIDASAPIASEVTREATEGCLRVAFDSDESARAVLRLVGAAGPLYELGPGPWSWEHRWLLDPPPAGAALYVELADPFENVAEYGPFELGALTFQPAVIISEVLANPAGAEPAQEFVELVNTGAQPVSLEGWRLRDDPTREGDVLPAMVLPPGAVALVVPNSFDPLSDADPLPDPTALLLFLDNGTLGSSGLSNGGEPVLLYDAADELRSAFGGTAADGALPGNGQSVVRVLGSGCADRGDWQLHPAGSSSPGWLD